MTRRIFRGIILTEMLIFGICTAFLAVIVTRFSSSMVADELKIDAHCVAQGLEACGAAYFENFRMEAFRVTWLGADGCVLFDSLEEAAQLENHAGRSEVQAALSVGEGEAVRYSETLGARIVYYAMRLGDGSVLRVSVENRSLWDIARQLIWYILPVFLLITLLAAALASRIAQRITKPINEIDLDSPQVESVYRELRPLAEKITRQNEQRSQQIDQLRRSQEEFRLITENMHEGMLITDAAGQVLSRNASALELLDGGMEESRIGEAVAQALASGHAEQLLHIGEAYYNAIANRVSAGGRVNGAIVIILDITEKQQREMLRREFTSNVSHELKTPLTTIYGISELLTNGMVKPQDVERFARNIHDESGRMISLIEDLIKLSQLDENPQPFELMRIDLYQAAHTVVKRLLPAAGQRGICITLSGVPAFTLGAPAIVDEMIYNLVDNAIKYNKEGGRIEIRVSVEDMPAVVVEDTGIGIAKIHQNRVFERFYRVDKSHSRKIGGTGLGLSIVKHAAAFHGATVELESQEGLGTRVTLRFRPEEGRA